MGAAPVKQQSSARRFPSTPRSDRPRERTSPPVGPHSGAQQHGGLRPSELAGFGLNAAEVIDFSASVNPLGASPRAVAALSTVDYSRYPDPECGQLRAA